MQPPPDDSGIAAFMLALAAGSVVTWIVLLRRWLRHRRILPFESRRLVPWGPFAGLLAGVFVLIALTAAISTGFSAPPPEASGAMQAAERLLGLMMMELTVTGIALALVVLLSGADFRDLGLPLYVGELIRDIRIGAVGCLAAFAPVYGLLILSRYLLNQMEEPPHHPLVETVAHDPYFGVIFLASLAAVVVAPVCEEVVFRLLLQGWLEKWETKMTHVEQPAPCDIDIACDSSPVDTDRTMIDEPPPRGVAGLPYGWVPILVSSLFFALAHIGYGPEPVPLFLLALLLGYQYQRTHRIAPCIVTHALFNLIAIIGLWQMVSLAPE